MCIYYAIAKSKTRGPTVSAYLPLRRSRTRNPIPHWELRLIALGISPPPAPAGSVNRSCERWYRVIALQTWATYNAQSFYRAFTGLKSSFQRLFVHKSRLFTRVAGLYNLRPFPVSSRLRFVKSKWELGRVAKRKGNERSDSCRRALGSVFHHSTVAGKRTNGMVNPFSFSRCSIPSLPDGQALCSESRRLSHLAITAIRPRNFNLAHRSLAGSEREHR